MSSSSSDGTGAVRARPILIVKLWACPKCWSTDVGTTGTNRSRSPVPGAARSFSSSSSSIAFVSASVTGWTYSMNSSAGSGSSSRQTRAHSRMSATSASGSTPNRIRRPTDPSTLTPRSSADEKVTLRSFARPPIRRMISTFSATPSIQTGAPAATTVESIRPRAFARRRTRSFTWLPSRRRIRKLSPNRPSFSSSGISR